MNGLTSTNKSCFSNHPVQSKPKTTQQVPGLTSQRAVLLSKVTEGYPQEALMGASQPCSVHLTLTPQQHHMWSRYWGTWGTFRQGQQTTQSFKDRHLGFKHLAGKVRLCLQSLNTLTCHLPHSQRQPLKVGHIPDAQKKQGIALNINTNHQQGWDWIQRSEADWRSVEKPRTYCRE